MPVVFDDEERPTGSRDPVTAPSRPAPERLRKFMGAGKQEGDTGSSGIIPSGYDVGGVATDVAAKVLPPEGAAAVGYAANVATDVVPVLMGGAAGAAAKAPEAAKWLMQSALKPVINTIETGKASRAINTLLARGIPATKSGVEMLRTQIDALEREVTHAIAVSKGSFDKMEVLKEFKSVLAKFREQGNPSADLATIRAAAKEFFNHPMLRGGSDISVQTAQALKEGTYRALGDRAYGMGLKPAAGKESQKAIARGLRKGIERTAEETTGSALEGSAHISDIAQHNALQSELLNAMKILSRRTGVEASKNPFGLGWLIHDPGGFPFWAWLAERSPWAKSKVAEGLYKGFPGTGVAAGTVTGAASGMPPD